LPGEGSRGGDGRGGHGQFREDRDEVCWWRAKLDLTTGKRAGSFDMLCPPLV
jgi:hypothetical protein